MMFYVLLWVVVFSVVFFGLSAVVDHFRKK